jgi:hypothetical protein
MLKSLQHNNRPRSLLCGVFLGLFSIVCAHADEAEKLLGVHNLDPVVREVIDEAYADGNASLATLIRKVSKGEMHPGAAAQQLVSSAEAGAMKVLGDLGLDAQAAGLTKGWQAFSKAKIAAKTSESIKLPNIPKGAASTALPALHHAKASADSPNVDKRLKQLDRQLSHAIEGRPKTSRIEEHPKREAHVRDVAASASAPDAALARSTVKRPNINDARPLLRQSNVNATEPPASSSAIRAARPDVNLPNGSAGRARANGASMGSIRPAFTANASAPGVSEGSIAGHLRGADIDTQGADRTARMGDVPSEADANSPSFGRLSEHILSKLAEPSTAFASGRTGASTGTSARTGNASSPASALPRVGPKVGAVPASTAFSSNRIDGGAPSLGNLSQPSLSAGRGLPGGPDFASGIDSAPPAIGGLSPHARQTLAGLSDNPSLGAKTDQGAPSFGSPSEQSLANPEGLPDAPNFNPLNGLDSQESPESESGDVQQNITQKANVDGMADKVRQSVNLDGLSNKIQGRLNLPAIDKEVTTAVALNLNDARDKVKAAVGGAFLQVNAFMQQQVDEKKAAADQDATTANSIVVPPITTHRSCVKRFAGVCVRHADIPNANSVALHNTALAQQATADSNASASQTEYQKYLEGQTKLIGTEADTFSNLDSVFASANSSTVVATQISSDPSSTATAEAPADQKSRNARSQSDTELIVIADDITETIVTVGTITAAIGDNAFATTEIGDIGDVRDTRIGGDVNQRIVAPGVISAAIGYDSVADVRIGNTDGTIGTRVDRNIVAAGVLAASIGAESSASVSLGNIDGTVDRSAKQDVAVVGALAASLGADTTAEINLANLSENARVGSLDQNILVASPAIAAAIGYDSDAIISAGQINANVAGNVTQNIVLGSITAAAIGANTETIISVGNVNQAVSGDLTQSITVGDVINAAIGANTSANTDIGVIDAPVGGSVTQAINIGGITTATVGVNTGAETVVGAIRAPVSGNVNMNIDVGYITTFSLGIGIGSDTDIRARTYVGSIFQPVNGNTNISVQAGAINSIGFGLDISTAFGELRIVENGCTGSTTRLGNIGNPC